MFILPRMRITYDSYFHLPKAREGEGAISVAVRIPFVSAFALALPDLVTTISPAPIN